MSSFNRQNCLRKSLWLAQNNSDPNHKSDSQKQDVHDSASDKNGVLNDDGKAKNEAGTWPA